MELLEQFGIDWHTLIAQIVNFLVVLTVLYLFAYKPILKLFHERTAKIDKSLKDAAKIEKRVIAIEKEHSEMVHKAKLEAQKILKEAEVRGQQQSEAMIVSAKDEVKGVIAKAKSEIEATKNNMITDAKKDIAVLVTLSVEKILSRTMNTEDNAKFVEKILAEVEHEVKKK